MPTRRRDSLLAEAAFHARLAELGAELLEDRWLGVDQPHRVRCVNGHACSPCPSNARRSGICRACAGKDPAAAEAAFRARLDELGAELLEDRWLGGQLPHRVRCAAGHECTPRPSNVRAGKGICVPCGGKDPAAAEAAFRARLDELGAELLEARWLGTERPHRVRCAAGHEATPWPGGVIGGGGLCRVCAGTDPATAAAAFRARLVELGAELLEDRWLGANTPHQVRCAAGHDSAPWPSTVKGGGGICGTCAGNDPGPPGAHEAAFRARLTDLGAELLEDRWLGVDQPHKVRCAAGHKSSPRPGNVARGQGICRQCRTVADAVYVVTHPRTGVVKVGVTHGDGQRRLAAHARDGYTEVLVNARCDDALDLERTVLATMADAGWAPVRGREYFARGALGTILDVVDGWLAADAA